MSYKLVFISMGVLSLIGAILMYKEGNITEIYPISYCVLVLYGLVLAILGMVIPETKFEKVLGEDK